MFKCSHRPHGRLTFCSLFAGRWCQSRWWHSVNRELPHLLQHSCACSCSKVPITPMGKCLVDMSISILIFYDGCCLSLEYVLSVPETSTVPIAPMGDSRFARCLQGGGVFVRGGTVSIVNSQIYSNTANGNRQSVRATETLPISHRPDGNSC